jgi:hypothetical protein
MLRNLCTPLTMKIIGLGLPLHHAERVAAVMVIWVVVLCAMMGYTISIPGIPVPVPDEVSGSVVVGHHGIVPVSNCGNLPERTGITQDIVRSFLHRQ